MAELDNTWQGGYLDHFTRAEAYTKRVVRDIGGDTVFLDNKTFMIITPEYIFVQKAHYPWYAMPWHKPKVYASIWDCPDTIGLSFASVSSKLTMAMHMSMPSTDSSNSFNEWFKYARTDTKELNDNIRFFDKFFKLASPHFKRMSEFVPLTEEEQSINMLYARQNVRPPCVSELRPKKRRRYWPFD